MLSYRLALGLFAAACLCGAAERLKLAYFYDQDDSSFVFLDLDFADARRGMAVGYIQYERRAEPAGLATVDGGRTWKQIKLPAPGSFVYFDRQATAWLGDNRGRVWTSAEPGSTWKRAGGLEGIRQMLLEDGRGWAVGAPKAVFMTQDGGAHWKRSPVGDLPDTKRDHTTYTAIAFADEKHGIIAGRVQPPRRRWRLPEYLEPEQAMTEVPATTVLLQTTDGGVNWKPSKASIFGIVRRLVLSPEAVGLALFEFQSDFPYPSDLYRLDLRTGANDRSFRRADRAVKDVSLRGRTGWLASIDSKGRLRGLPGKLRLYKSEDLMEWTEIPVDYRAVASLAAIAWAGDRLWVATDNGMLLSLE